MDNRDQALEKAQEVIDAWVACVSAGRTPGSKAVVDIKAEELIDILLDEFNGDLDQDLKDHPGKLVQIFDGQSRLNTVSLGGIPDAMIPVAVMREVLHVHKVMFNPKNVMNWKSFVARFGRYIIE